MDLNIDLRHCFSKMIGVFANIYEDEIVITLECENCLDTSNICVPIGKSFRIDDLREDD